MKETLFATAGEIVGIAIACYILYKVIKYIRQKSKKGKNKDKFRVKDLTPAEKEYLKNAVGRCCELPGCSVEYPLEIHHIRGRGFPEANKLRYLFVLCKNHHETIGVSKTKMLLWAKNGNTPNGRFKNKDIIKKWRYGF